MDNKTRRSCAFVALEAYNEARGENDTMETDAIDLIADLLHLVAVEEAGNPEAILKNALMHYEEEK
jgi:hypothetical protein